MTDDDAYKRLLRPLAREIQPFADHHHDERLERARAFWQGWPEAKQLIPPGVPEQDVRRILESCAFGDQWIAEKIIDEFVRTDLKPALPPIRSAAKSLVAQLQKLQRRVPTGLEWPPAEQLIADVEEFVTTQCSRVERLPRKKSVPLYHKLLMVYFQARTGDPHARPAYEIGCFIGLDDARDPTAPRKRWDTLKANQAEFRGIQRSLARDDMISVPGADDTSPPTTRL